MQAAELASVKSHACASLPELVMPVESNMSRMQGLKRPQIASSYLNQCCLPACRSVLVVSVELLQANYWQVVRLCQDSLCARQASSCG